MKTKVLTICDVLRLFPLFNIFTKDRATVFMMHHFCCAHDRERGCIPADTLEGSLNYLSTQGYSVISLSAFVRALIDGAPLYKTVVFTVDDGYRDFYDNAYPVFRKYDMPAAVFLATDFINGKSRLWWDQVRDAVTSAAEDDIEIDVDGRRFRYPLCSDREREKAIHQITEQCKQVPDRARRAVVDQLGKRGSGSVHVGGEKKAPLSWDQISEMQSHNIEFYPHTKTHPVLAQCEPDTVRKEISDSKKVIEQKINHAADIFCYPNGTFCDFDDTVVALLKEEGYRAAVTAEEGFDNSRQVNDLFRLRRYPFPADILRFKQLVSGLEGLKHTLRRLHG